jgi:hypothetical protein
MMCELAQRPATRTVRPIKAGVSAHLYFLPEQPRKRLQEVNRLLALICVDLRG